MDTLPSPLRQAIERLAEKRRLRQIRPITQPERPAITLQGQRVIDFCSNDYLGFSQHPAIIQASMEALAQYGTGTGGARLIGGTLDLHTELEAELCRFKGTEAALIFNSGYQANVGVLSALVARGDVIFADRLNHASLVDGAQLSRAKRIRYPHGDLATLEKRLADTPATTPKWIVTDTVFSMDGDLAPLHALYSLAERYNAWLILDEAHATGVFGPTHRSGLWETTGLGAPARVIQIGTFSKALGSFGAYVAASRDVVEALIQFSRSFIYSTSLPPSVVAANLAALRLLMSDGRYTQALWENVRTFQSAAAMQGLQLPAHSPIIPILIGDAAQAVQCAATLLEKGFYIQAIRPPTVPEGTSRLRMTLTAKHTPEQIHALATALACALGT